jgi:hypothetical protein
MEHNDFFSNATNAAFDAMALFATLHTAADVTRSIVARRSGFDPSEQLPEATALSEMTALLTDIEAHHHQLRRNQIATNTIASRPNLHEEAQHEEAQYEEKQHEEAREEMLLLHFHTLLLLRTQSRLLHLFHQHCLSLFPSIAAERIESVRLAEQHAKALLEATPDDFAEDFAALLDSWLREMSKVLEQFES